MMKARGGRIHWKKDRKGNSILKYLKQAKKNGKLLPLVIGMLAVTGIGLTIVIITVYEMAVYGELQSFIAPLNSVAAVANIPLGRIIVGSYIAYVGMAALPRWSKYAQIREEYVVACDGEYMEIAFRGWNWRVKRESFSPTDLFFRDSNHKFVSVLRGYQVYNAIEAFYPEYIGKGKKQEKGSSSVIEDFPNIRKMTQEEKKEYLKRKEKGNGCLSVFMGFLAFGFGLAAVRLLQDIPQKVLWKDKLMLLAFCAVFFLAAFAFIMVIVMMRRTKQWILTTDCFAVTGYSYQKKKENMSSGDGHETLYYAKVWDGQSVYLPRWFPIGEEEYKREEPVAFELYFYKDRSGYTEIDAYVKEKNSLG